MASRMEEMLEFCRFCLSRDELNPLIKSKASFFTTQDIQHCTGIRVLAEEISFSAICDQCCSVLQKSIAFRSACLRNDILFKQLLSARHESIEDSIEISDDQFDDIAPVKIEKDESRKLLITSNGDENMLNTEKERKNESTYDQAEETNATEDSNHFGDIPSVKIEKDESRKELITSNGDENILNTEKERKNESTDDQAEETNATEDEVQVKPKKRFMRKIQLCNICGNFVNNIHGHISNHRKQKKYSCPHCQIQMTNATNMKRHIESVHEKKMIVCCDQCGKGFTNRNTYHVHMALQHGIGKAYECTVCSKTFNTYPAYSRHKIKWHTVKKEVSCTICEMKFISKKQLGIHQRVHSADQPFACKHCPKRFKSSYARNIHQLTHSGIRFPCTLCKKSYSYKSLLNMHLRKDHHDTLGDATDIKNEDS